MPPGLGLQASPPAKRRSRLSFVASDARFRHGTLGLQASPPAKQRSCLSFLGLRPRSTRDVSNPILGSSRKCAAFLWGGSGVPACKATQSLIFCSERCSLSTRDVSNPARATTLCTERLRAESMVRITIKMDKKDGTESVDPVP